MTNVAKIKLYQSDIFKKSTVKVYSKVTKTKHYYGFKKLTREEITNDFFNDGQKYDCFQKLRKAVLM